MKVDFREVDESKLRLEEDVKLEIELAAQVVEWGYLVSGLKNIIVLYEANESNKYGGPYAYDQIAYILEKNEVRVDLNLDTISLLKADGAKATITFIPVVQKEKKHLNKLAGRDYEAALLFNVDKYTIMRVSSRIGSRMGAEHAKKFLRVENHERASCNNV